jgi:hypothetical protein
MKAIKAIALFSLLVICLVSCKKEVTPAQEGEFASCSNTGAILTPVAIPVLCSPDTFSLCAGRTNDIGEITVGTGLDNKIYIIYTVTGNWRLKELHLYVGNDAALPVNNSGNAVPGQFPYSKTFNAPYLVQQYMFVVTTSLNVLTIAAHASVVRVNSWGQIVESQTAWGDGCSGTRINDHGSWATKFYYTRGSCTAIATPATVICSQIPAYFYGVGTMAWPDVNGTSTGSVTVGNFDYTEGQGREIFNSADVNGIPADAKTSFVDVSTLRMSYTNCALDPQLLTSVTVAEQWLSTLGKLSPSNLPNGTQTVKDANAYMITWINAHDCNIR